MKKTSLVLACFLLMLLAGCGKAVAIQTELGEFTLARIRYVDDYDTLVSEDGKELMVIGLRSDGFDETKFKSYFCSEDGTSVARAKIGSMEVPCVGVGYQGASGSDWVEYTLIFQIPLDQRDAAIELQVPKQSWISLK